MKQEVFDQEKVNPQKERSEILSKMHQSFATQTGPQQIDVAIQSTPEKANQPNQIKNIEGKIANWIQQEVFNRILKSNGLGTLKNHAVKSSLPVATAVDIQTESMIMTNNDDMQTDNLMENSEVQNDDHIDIHVAERLQYASAVQTEYIFDNAIQPGLVVANATIQTKDVLTASLEISLSQGSPSASQSNIVFTVDSNESPQLMEESSYMIDNPSVVSVADNSHLVEEKAHRDISIEHDETPTSDTKSFILPISPPVLNFSPETATIDFSVSIVEGHVNEQSISFGDVLIYANSEVAISPDRLSNVAVDLEQEFHALQENIINGTIESILTLLFYEIFSELQTTKEDAHVTEEVPEVKKSSSNSNETTTISTVK